MKFAVTSELFPKIRLDEESADKKERERESASEDSSLAIILIWFHHPHAFDSWIQIVPGMNWICKWMKEVEKRGELGTWFLNTRAYPKTRIINQKLSLTWLFPSSTLYIISLLFLILALKALAREYLSEEEGKKNEL